MALPFLKAQARDLSALEQLMREHERAVLRLAVRLTGKIEDAQDVAQEVFLKLHRELDKFQDRREIAPWLYRVTVNACFDERRRKKRAPEAAMLESGWQSSEPTPEQSAMVRQDHEMLQRGMETLSKRERAVIALREMEGLSTADVAAILGSSESTVRVQIANARLKLRKFLEAARGKKV